MSAPVAPQHAPVVTTSPGIDEHEAWSINGWFGVLGAAICGLLTWWIATTSLPGYAVLPILAGVILLVALVIVPPGQTKVVLFFGRYMGTVRSSGFALVTPLTRSRSVSVRVRNFETNHLKVNDADGNPVEIAAVVVWQ